jgi:hypothetical protein
MSKQTNEGPFRPDTLFLPSIIHHSKERIELSIT